MTNTRKAIVSFLLLVSVVLMFLAPNVNSQQFRSITSYATTTYASYQISTSTITTSGEFATTTIASLSSPPAGYNCTYSFVIILYVAEATSPNNQKLHFSFSSTRSVDFVLFASMGDELNWESSGLGCDVAKVTNFVVKQQGVSSYSYDWAPEIMGSPVLLFLYTPRGMSGNADISLTYETQYLKRATPQVTMTKTATDTWTYYTTAEISFLEANYLWLAPLALAVVVVALLLTLRVRGVQGRKRPKRKRKRNP